MGRLLLLSVLLAGCGPAAVVQPVGPDAPTQERALQITWEGVYGMERASRPTSITWWSSDGCGEDLAITGVSSADVCAADTEGSNGDIYIRWQGTFTASYWSRSLVMWRQYLLTGTMTIPTAEDLALVAASNASLGDF